MQLFTSHKKLIATYVKLVQKSFQYHSNEAPTKVSVVRCVCCGEEITVPAVTAAAAAQDVAISLAAWMTLC